MDEPTPTAVTEQVEGPGIESPVLVQPEEACAFVIFGASGDLTSRKQIPAIYNLAAQNLLPDGFAIVGFAITPWSNNEFREQMLNAIKESHDIGRFKSAVWDKLASSMHYIGGDFESAQGYEKLS